MKISSRFRLTINVGTALLLGAAIQTLSAQGAPKLVNGGISNPGKRPPPDCPELVVPAPAGTSKPKPASPASQSQRLMTAPGKGGGGGGPPAPNATPAAVSVWTHTANGLYSYCIQAGVINSESTLGVPMTLSLTDDRAIDEDYIKDYAALGQPVPLTHITAPSSQHTFAAPLASGQSVVPSQWCQSGVDWKKRPLLLLTLTAPASPEHAALKASCLIAPGQKLTNPTGFKPALESKVKTGKWPTVTPPRGTGTPIPLEPAKKIDLPKSVLPK